MSTPDQVIMDLAMILIAAVCLCVAVGKFGYLLGGLKW